MRQTYIDCETCDLKECPPECFERHVGSMIALKKVASSTGVKVAVIDETGKIQ